MNPVLLNIYGPLSIHAYGLCIAIGVIVGFHLLYHDKKMQKIATENQITTSLQIMIISGYFGGRALSMFAEPESFKNILTLFAFWEPGLSILGAILGVICSLVIYLTMKRIPLLLFIDRISLYAPLVQAFGRIGCFFTGCCYGIPTKSWLAITYTHPFNQAPLHCSLMPSQIYSSLLMLCIFIFLYFIQQHRSIKPGTLFLSYLVLASLERFLIDFIRWDRIFITEPSFLQLFSVHQWIALSLSCIATAGILFLHNRKQ